MPVVDLVQVGGIVEVWEWQGMPGSHKQDSHMLLWTQLRRRK